MKSDVRRIEAEATGTATLRDDLTPPTPVDVPMADNSTWDFSTVVDPQWIWRGEGPRCEAIFIGGGIQCELIYPHARWSHSSQGSVVSSA